MSALDTITEQIKQKIAMSGTVRAKVKFDFGDDGSVFIDATQNPPVITHDDDEADTTLSCSIDTFQGFLDGSKDPNMCFMMGQLKVKGSMGTAMKLNALLED